MIKKLINIYGGINNMSIRNTYTLHPDLINTELTNTDLTNTDLIKTDLTDLEFGKFQGSDFNNIIAYSCNDKAIYHNTTSDKTNPEIYSYIIKDDKKIYCGIKWQCVEYVRRWLILMYDISFDQIDMAYMLYTNASFFDIKKSKYVKYRRHSNLSKSSPKVGSIVLWDKSDKSHTGHVAIISATDDNYAYISEQNWDYKRWSNNYSRRLGIRKQYKNDQIYYSLIEDSNPYNSIILGWLRLDLH